MVDKQAAQIRRMFAAVAHRYDFLNHLLSLSLDRLWRRRLRRQLLRRLPEGSRILDLCTGTGDVAFTLAVAGSVVGADFCHPMLVRAREKARRRRAPVHFVEADSLATPFPAESFDAVTIAFGLRNLEDYRRGLREMWRILRRGGRLAILEFAIPTTPLFRRLYLFYFTRVLPWIGGLVSGNRGAYSYLPASVQTFPSPETLCAELREVGFDEVVRFPQTLGVTVLYLARK
ncbi:MAG: bifunctional demethylmenaquinone methyltransferase/2-methoxy-6-polyprenyl-1,4-benzoquinol methylase UbiE [Acidobacteriota bacterium]